MKTVSEARQSGFKWACIYDDVPVMAWVKKPEYSTFGWKDTELDVVCIIGAGEYVPENIIDLMAANAASKGNDMFADNITDMQIDNFLKSVKDLADFTFNVR